MKRFNLNLYIKTSLLMLTVFSVLSCQKIEDLDVVKPNQDIQFKSTPTVYSLALIGNSGSPVLAGFPSAIYKVDLCSTPIGYDFVSSIKIGITSVTSVTGICDMPGVLDYAWAVTGRNSNFPQRLLKVKISTGVATVAAVTTVPLQDIENYNSTGLFVAIKEGTSQLMKVNVPAGVCVAFAPVGPVAQYNGLTVVGEKFQAISGITNLICSPNYGDIFEYPITGGNYTGKYSYKNLPANGSWTMKELGFYFDKACGRGWVVGSSSGIISHNKSVTPCILPSPTFLYDTYAHAVNYPNIYDFMVKP